MLTLSVAAWSSLLAQSTAQARAQALAALFAAAPRTIEFLDASGAVIRTVTTAAWSASANPLGGYNAIPGAFTDAGTGAGIPATAVFKAAGAEVFRCTCSTEQAADYRLRDTIEAGVPIERGSLAFRVLGQGAEAPGQPQFTGSPVIGGEPKIGSTLTAIAGATTGSPTPTHTFTWLQGAAVIGTGPTILLVAEHYGKGVTLRDTATNIHGTAVRDSAESALVTSVLNAEGVPNPLRVIAGGSVDIGGYVIGGTPPYSVTIDNLPEGLTLAGTVLSAAPDGQLLYTGLNILVVDSEQEALPPPVDPPPPVEPIEGADADWIARSQADGVLWAHDFREDEEFTTFHRGETRVGLADGGPSNVTNPPYQPYHSQLVPTPFGGSRAIESIARGCRIIEDVPASAALEIQTIKVDDITAVVEPWTTEYDYVMRILGNDGLFEHVSILSRDVVNSTVTVRRHGGPGNPMDSSGNKPGKAILVSNNPMLCKDPAGRWNRPYASFPAGQNGKAEDDYGLNPANTNGARKARTWTSHGSFREGYIGHRSYWDTNVGPALYKDWTPSGSTTRVDAWEGDEIYVQFRVKISASRALHDTGKLFFVQNLDRSTNAQFYMPIGKYSGSYTRVPDDWPYPEYGNSAAGLITWASDAQAKYGTRTVQPQGGSANAATQTWVSGETVPVWQQPPDDFPNARINNPLGYHARTWHWPFDRWVTLLLHFKPGRDSMEPHGPKGNLTAPAPSRAASDKSVDVLQLDDVSTFYDPAEPGQSPYFVYTYLSPVMETMRVIAIDRGANTLTVERNAVRSGGLSTDLRGWASGTVIAMGPCRFPTATGGLTSVLEPAYPNYMDIRNERRLGFRESTIEAFVAVEGETEYKKVIGGDDFCWIFGDTDKGTYGSHNYTHNPPGINNIELGQYINLYAGSGGAGGVPRSSSIQYTQVIASRNFIPCPQV